jgi:thiol-disulfide isomerase/thioredoxin
MRTRLILLALATTAALTLAGCGGEPGATQAAPSKTTAPAPTTEAASAEPTQSVTSPPAKTSKPVPESLNFTTTTVDGKPFKGASLVGKPTVLWFWAAWCPNCRGAAPEYKRAADTFGDRVNLVGVAGKSDTGSMRDFISDYDLSGITHLAGKNDPLWTKYGITHQHQYVVIDEAGKIVHTGELSEQELTDQLTELAA